MKKLSFTVMLLVVSCAPATVLTGCSSFNPQDPPPQETPTTIENPSNGTTSTSTTATTSTQWAIDSIHNNQLTWATAQEINQPKNTGNVKWLGLTRKKQKQ